MPFDVKVTSQSSDVEHGIKSRLYQGLYESASQSKCSKACIRVGGFGIGLVSGILTLTKRISRVVESILKGFINIFGCPFSSECRFFRGVKQILWDAVWQAGVRLPLSLVFMVFGIFIKVVCIAIYPKQHLKGLWLDHDQVQKKLEIERPKIERFTQAKNAVEASCVDVDNLRELGECYLGGLGTDANKDEAIRCFERAAEQNDCISMKILGDIYKTEDKKTSLDWYKRAADAGDLAAMNILGVHYYKGGQGDTQQAIEYFRNAMQNGHVFSTACLLEVLRTIASQNPAFAEEIPTLEAICSPYMMEEARTLLGIIV